MVGKPSQVKVQMMLSSCFVVGALPCLMCLSFVFLMCDDVLHVCDIDASFLFFVDSIWSHLKKWYHNCLEKVKGYIDNVFDFDELISPQSLFVHFLGPKPSNHVQKNMEIVRKSKCIDFVNIRRPLDDFSLLIIPPPFSFLGMATKFSKGKLAEVQAKKAKTGLKEGLLSKRHCKDDKSSKGEDPMITSNVVMLNLPSSILLHPHCLWSWLPLSTRVRKLREGKNWHLVPSMEELKPLMPWLK